MTLRCRVRLLVALLLPAALASAAAPDIGARAVVDWMKRTAHPFATCEPRDDDSDLAFLRPLIGGAHIVALGEGTHGTAEFFTMKHRITRYLATRMGFTVFAIEANMPEAYRMNDYVLTGRGDPRQLLDGMYFWTWNTHEVLDMIEWMRAFNASGKGRIQFTGFDMQTPDTAAAIARRTLVLADPAGADSLDACLAALRAARAGHGAGFATATGSLPAPALAGHHVRYSGWIRTRDIVGAGFAGLWLRADTPARHAMAFDNMQARHVGGTRDWARYAIDLEIPAGVSNINFGMLLGGEGTAWFDSLRLEIDGHAWSSDSLDLALEDAAYPRGFWPWRGSSYSIAMDAGVAHDGTRSLRIQSTRSAAPRTPDAAFLAARAAQLVARAQGERGALARATSSTEAEWAIQNLRVIEQCARLQGSEAGGAGVRDSSMAANAEWILAREKPGTRMVIWAHNAHVARDPGWMGAHLAQRHGRDMVVLGFAMHDGQYTAWSDSGLRANDAEVPAGDALEGLCRLTGLPRFVLDLRTSRHDAAAARWLAQPQRMRSVGAVATTTQFGSEDIARNYDAIVYVGETHATRLLHPQ